MKINEPIEWVIQGPSQKQMDEAVEKAKAVKAEAYKVKLQNEYDEFREMRAFVLKNMSFLRGKKVAIEVGSIQFLPSHECIIINDLLLVSFTEAKELIVELRENEKKAAQAKEAEKT